MRITANSVLFSTILTLSLSACGESGGLSASQLQDPMLDPLAPEGWADATADFVGRAGETIGRAALKDTPGTGVLIRVDLKGLSQGWHGIHLHQVGDCSDYEAGFKRSGGHVDPDNYEHGLLNPNGPERADMANIYAGADGRATVEIYNDKVSLYPSEDAAEEAGPYALIDDDGFAIIVHANPDDHMSQPIGGAGERVACAAIKGTS